MGTELARAEDRLNGHSTAKTQAIDHITKIDSEETELWVCSEGSFHRRNGIEKLVELRRLENLRLHLYLVKGQWSIR